jgi:hypothetical protein
MNWQMPLVTQRLTALFFRLVIGLAFALASGLAGAATPLRINIPPVEQSAPSSVYYSKLLKLALNKTTATDGAFELVEYPQLLTLARFEAELKRNGIVDVIWAVTNQNLEEDFLPIKIDLIKDLNSYRIFLIRKEDQPIFTMIHQLDDLHALKAGQGSHWADTDILIANDLPVVTSPQFEPLFTMLIGKRFDYFPRGLNEIWSEEKLFSERGLSIEKTLMLHYNSPKYFFVNRKNTALADRIERGLKLAMADGSFEKLFNSIPDHKRGYQELLAKKRTQFNLKLPSTTPAN